MRDPPELLLYLVPIAVIAGIAAGIGQVTGSNFAWLVAGGALGVAIGPVLAGLQYLGAAWRSQHEAPSAGEEAPRSARSCIPTTSAS